MRSEMEWDHIVVGGGAAGAIVAALLSEDPDRSVLLIEAGGGARNPMLHVPGGIFFLKGNARYHWLIDSDRDPTRNERIEVLTPGRTLGGSSAINGAVYVKGVSADYESWEQLAGPDWGVARVARAFDRVDERIDPQPPTRPHPLSTAFLDALRAGGLPPTTGALTGSGVGAMSCPSSVRNGWRRSSATAYLTPARSRPNLQILTDAVVDRLSVSGTRITGVVYRSGGRTAEARAQGEVILCAGALQTPGILMRSGLGPAEDLHALGIEVVADLPEVGLGLQDHPCIWISAYANQPSWTRYTTPTGRVAAGLRWLFGRGGPAGDGMCQVSGYGNVAGDPSAAPEYQVTFTPVGYVVKDDGVAFLKEQSVTAAVSLCRPGGRGRVRLRDANPETPPDVSLRLLAEKSDVDLLARSCARIRDVLASAPMADLLLGEALPGAQVKGDADWKAYVRKAAVNMCHPAGTCRMGTDAAAVVDPQLRVRGVEGLRIADASIMPHLTSGNTAAPTMMIAEQAAAFMRGTPL